MRTVRLECWNGTQFNLRIMEGFPRGYPFPGKGKRHYRESNYFVARRIKGEERDTDTLYALEAWGILRGLPTMSFRMDIFRESVAVRDGESLDSDYIFHLWRFDGDKGEQWFAVKAK